MATSAYRGADAAIRDLAKIKAFSPNAFASALFQEGQVELKEVKIQTPVLTGALRASEKLEGPFRQGRRIWVVISAGSVSVSYAFDVHEDTEAFHPRGGGAKYIEGPLRASIPFLPARVAARIDLNKAL